MKNFKTFAGHGGEGKARWFIYSVIMVLRDGGGQEIKEVTASPTCSNNNLHRLLLNFCTRVII